MDKKISKALITSMLAGVVVSSVPMNAFAAEKVPSDLNKIKNEEAKRVVKELFEKGKINGFDDNTFRPDKKVTRAEFAAMLLSVVNYDNKSETNRNVNFADSKKGTSWHYDVLNKAYNIGLISGKGTKGNGEIIMAPNAPITREEMLTILVRAYELNNVKATITDKEVNESLKKFVDASKLPSWSKAPVVKSLKYGITSGLTENRIGAGEKGDRLQSAMFSYRLMKNPGGEKTPIIDKTAPVITLKGSKDVVIYEGDTYKDAGVTVIDNVDGNISSSVVKSGDAVNSNKPGKYVVKYNAKDKAVEVSRTVIVKEAIAKLETDKEIIHIKKSGATVGEIRGILSERHAIAKEGIHFVSKKSLTDKLGSPEKVSNVQNLVVHVNHTKVDNKFTKSTIYDVKFDKDATDVQVDTTTRTVTVNDTHTLADIKSAFETKAQAIIGENSVEFFTEMNDSEVVYGDTIVLIEGLNNDVSIKNVTYKFGDSLVVEAGESSLTVKGLKFEDSLDLYSYNPTTKTTTKLIDGAEVRVDGTYEFKNLATGFYVAVQKPLEKGKPGEKAYEDEYQQRLKNENVYEIKPILKAEGNSAGAYRLSANYPGFSLLTPDATADFVKDEKKVAKITGGGDLYAEIVYKYRTERVKFKNMKLTFGTEAVDHDKNSATPNVNYPTVLLNPTADYEQFTLGQTVLFTLVLKDKDASGNVTSKVELPLQAKVVLKDAALTLEVTPQ
ncbi:S-layer homology domain-containing protein [Bacillus cereus]|uniref:S-layer homology domain-containing protein n=1 Tax=Bacillus cereus TaxID=1396 RepID=UPI0030791CA2